MRGAAEDAARIVAVTAGDERGAIAAARTEGALAVGSAIRRLPIRPYDPDEARYGRHHRRTQLRAGVMWRRRATTSRVKACGRRQGRRSYPRLRFHTKGLGPCSTPERSLRKAVRSRNRPVGA
jgi:hypothetical protein